MKVKVDQFKSLDAALLFFNRQLRAAGVFEELKRRDFYRKPSEIRYEREKHRLARINNKRR